MSEVVAVLLISYDRGYLDAVDGLNRYRDQHLLDWDIRIISHGSGTKAPSDAWWVIPAAVLLHHLPKERKGDQVIAFTGRSTDHTQSAAHFDDQVFGHLAARHLFERGYRHFAAVEGIQHQRLQKRLNGFKQAVADLQLPYTALSCGSLDKRGMDTSLIQGIEAIKMPVGVYSPIDPQAAWYRDQFLDAGIPLPDRIGLVGTGDLHPPCFSRAPFLTTVAFPWKLIGFEAGHLLHRLMQGAPQVTPKLLRPFQVIERQSTQMVIAHDELVRNAIAHMSRQLDRPLELVAADMGVSLNTLRRRFQADLRESPKQVFDRLRIEQACALLRDTNLSMDRIAQLCGFSGNTPFGVAFKRLRGCTPTLYRSAV